MRAVLVTASVVSSVAVAVWLGGLVALGAIAAPVVFSTVSMPQSADAMTMVFRRFDTIAMTCAALALVAEASRVLVGPRFTRLEHARASVTALAAIATTYEGTTVSPRIAELHASGAIRGMGVAGLELSRLHDLAEALGKASVVLLVGVAVLTVLARPRPSTA